MKLNRIFFTLLALCICGICGHAFGQKLYPVEGPLAAQTPQPIFKGQIRRPIFAMGSQFLLLKSWTLANGEVLTGKPKTAKATSVNMPPPKASAPPQPNLAFAWDEVYGQGFFVAHVLGKHILQGIFSGKQGTVLQVESLEGRNGVAVDNKGNIYKMTW